MEARARKWWDWLEELDWIVWKKGESLINVSVQGLGSGSERRKGRR